MARPSGYGWMPRHPSHRESGRLREFWSLPAWFQGGARMPRHRINHFRDTYVFPRDFPQRLVRFKEESRLPWAEIARLLGVYPHTVMALAERSSTAQRRAQMALQNLADEFGLGHLFTD